MWWAEQSRPSEIGRLWIDVLRYGGRDDSRSRNELDSRLGVGRVRMSGWRRLALAHCGRLIPIGIPRTRLQHHLPWWEWIGVAVCKTVGIAYVGSNPTPATQRKRASHQGERPTGDSGAPLAVAPTANCAEPAHARGRRRGGLVPAAFPGAGPIPLMHLGEVNGS